MVLGLLRFFRAWPSLEGDRADAPRRSHRLGRISTAATRRRRWGLAVPRFATTIGRKGSVRPCEPRRSSYHALGRQERWEPRIGGRSRTARPPGHQLLWADLLSSQDPRAARPCAGLRARVSDTACERPLPGLPPPRSC